MGARTTKRTSSILAAGVALAAAGLAVCLAPRYASAQSYRSQLYIGYQVPTNPDLSADARRMESKCMSPRVVTDQSCAVGNNAECRKQAEIAFRTCIAGIRGVQFAVYVCSGFLDPCPAGSVLQLVRHVSSAGALSDALNQGFHQIQSENYVASTGLYVSISGSECALTDGDGAEVSLGVYSDLQGKICAGAYYHLARVLDIGDEDGAIAEYREAIRLDPSDAAAHYSLGKELYYKGDYDGAIAEYREYTRLDPSDAYAHSVLGHALDDKGDYDGAIPEYREVIRLDPSDILAQLAHFDLGAALYHKGDYDGAIPEFREYIRLFPNFAAAHYSLGKALYHKGDYDGAIPEFREYIRLFPSDAYAHYQLGRALEKKGQLDAAFQEYRTAWKLAKANNPSPYTYSAKDKIKLQAAYHRLAKALGKE